MSKYEDLYLKNRRLLFYWGNRYAHMCSAVVGIEDLVQSGFIGLCEASQTYNPDKGAWGSWASLYIRNSMRDTLGLRKSAKEPLMLSLDEPAYRDDNGADCESLGETLPDWNIPDCDSDLLRRELSKTVRDAVNSIKNEQIREAVSRVYLKEEKRSKAAHAMGVTENTLNGMLTRGKRALRTNGRMMRALDLDLKTQFYAHKGVAAFKRDLTSVVEEAVIWRERQRSK